MDQFQKRQKLSDSSSLPDEQIMRDAGSVELASVRAPPPARPALWERMRQLELPEQTQVLPEDIHFPGIASNGVRRTIDAPEQESRTKDNRPKSLSRALSLRSPSRRATDDLSKLGQSGARGRQFPGPAAASKNSVYDTATKARRIMEEGNVPGLKGFLSEHGQFINKRYGPRNLPLLLLAARYGRVDRALPLCEEILAVSGVEVNAADNAGSTALHSACYRGLIELAERLIDEGIRIDTPNHGKFTALHYAVEEKRFSTVAMLVRRGANPNAVTEHGRTPLHKAAASGCVTIVNTLLSYNNINVSPRDSKSGHTPLHDACVKHDEVVKILIEKGADVHATDLKDMTPLHIAARYGRVNIVRELLAAGANPLCFTSRMESPESLAESFVGDMNREDIIELLYAKQKVKPGWPRLGVSTHVPRPGPDQQDVCEKFCGFMWPSVAADREFDVKTVWDMLYKPTPELGKTPRAASWIHLPSSNKTWVEDTFKVLHDSGRLLGHAAGQTPTDSSSQVVLRDILAFIKTCFDEVASGPATYQKPHFKLSPWSHSQPGVEEPQHMISLVVPLIDVDMQQPFFFNQDLTTESDHENLEATKKADSAYTRMVRTLTTCEGRPLSEKAKIHVDNCKALRRVYDTIDHARTLDVSFHEQLDPKDMNKRNGDQVVSRYIARYWYKQPGGAKEEKIHAEPPPRNDPRRTPSQVENQSSEPPAPAKLRWTESWRRERHKSHMSKCAKGNELLPMRFQQDGRLLSGEDLAVSLDLTTRQQMLTVPQLWLWKFGNIVVTAYPERWEAENRRKLPEIIRDNIAKMYTASDTEGHQDVSAQTLLESILNQAARFEAKFTVSGHHRTFNDAFAGEIAHVSSKVTECYTKYQKELGKVEQGFRQAVQEETTYLVMIDDILDEISMIKRVKQDQDRLYTEIHQAREEHGLKGPGMPWHGCKRPYQDQFSDLERLEEDANRVRKSTTTLLDLRQRQASTENVISMSKQSDILFKQSKVLFIFTGATVVFAPLSWINSLLALNIEHLTPSNEWWQRWQAFLASTLGLGGTLALCLGFWVLYDHRSNDERDADALGAEAMCPDQGLGKPKSVLPFGISTSRTSTNSMGGPAERRSGRSWLGWRNGEASGYSSTE